MNETLKQIKTDNGDIKKTDVKQNEPTTVIAVQPIANTNGVTVKRKYTFKNRKEKKVQNDVKQNKPTTVIAVHPFEEISAVQPIANTNGVTVKRQYTFKNRKEKKTSK
jgi:hypothetical protein